MLTEALVGAVALMQVGHSVPKGGTFSDISVRKDSCDVGTVGMWAHLFPGLSRACWAEALLQEAEMWELCWSPVGHSQELSQQLGHSELLSLSVPGAGGS